jgi:hypothetical protein
MPYRRFTTAAALALALVPGTAAAATDPATTAWQAGAKNMGVCSAFLGTAGVRDDVNRAIRLHGDQLGITSPGELFRVRAQQDVTVPPAQECLPRRLP